MTRDEWIIQAASALKSIGCPTPFAEAEQFCASEHPISKPWPCGNFYPSSSVEAEYGFGLPEWHTKETK